MVENPCILVIDQGTTSSRAIVFDAASRIVCVAQQEFRQIYPADGQVEHDPEDIWTSTLAVCRQAIAAAQANGASIAALGLTNQRETTLVWDRATGRPLYNAIVWQDRRTADVCARLSLDGAEPLIRQRTGLLLDPYFSASKIGWILDHVDGARAQAENGRLAFGTVDTYLIWRLTNGRAHLTDATNASRTSLYDIRKGQWDAELLRLFDIPESILPTVLDCSADFGQVDAALFGKGLPILGVAGDQQAALIGQACFGDGEIKSTYGTGCFVIANTGQTYIESQHRLLTTIGYQFDGQPCYALEGSIFVAGAAVQWLRDGLGIIEQASDTEALARGLGGNQGVYLVPAFTGLGAPYWAPDVRGILVGLTRATGRAELARAAIEAACYQTYDLIEAMSQDGVRSHTLRIDGGMVVNDWMCQFLADALNKPVDRPEIMETTALGAAYLAGLKAGVYESLENVRERWKRDRRFDATMGEAERAQMLNGWRRAVAAAMAY